MKTIKSHAHYRLFVKPSNFMGVGIQHGEHQVLYVPKMVTQFQRKTDLLKVEVSALG